MIECLTGPRMRFAPIEREDTAAIIAFRGGELTLASRGRASVKTIVEIQRFIETQDSVGAVPFSRRIQLST